mmetsp:Transcript_110067/g.190921  ORF Transcript_110067/g.190921 Transcript_110067/m.190921 type:complete len:304 (+) Transcript_110067:126-1037(+)
MRFALVFSIIACSFNALQARARFLASAPRHVPQIASETIHARREEVEHAMAVSASQTRSNVSNTALNAAAAQQGPAYADWVQWLLPQIPALGVDPLTSVLQQQVPLGITQANGGLWLEFGVFSGLTINLMAGQTSGVVHGFDSFQGLPEDWHIGTVPGAPANSRTIVKETFDLQGNLPPVRANVMLHRGWFDQTLPAFLQTLPPVGTPGSAVSLLHIDCDLYTSTVTVLESLAPRIIPGTVIVFDELVNFPEYRNHELKALYEFAVKHGRSFAPIGCMCAIDPSGVRYEGDGSCQAVAVRIVT